MMAAILVCGASVFTSCSSDDKDATAQANENRSEFVEHCRENLKDLAEKGYQNYAVIDFTSFNYRFTQNADNTGFDVTPAEDFTLIFKRTEQKDDLSPCQKLSHNHA